MTATLRQRQFGCAGAWIPSSRSKTFPSRSAQTVHVRVSSVATHSSPLTKSALALAVLEAACWLVCAAAVRTIVPTSRLAVSSIPSA